MGVLGRGSSIGSPQRVIIGLGGLYIAIAIVRAALGVAASKPLTGTIADFILVAGPGSLLTYGGYRLLHTDLHSSVYPRILTWCLGGFGLLLGIVTLRVFDPGVTIDAPFESVVLATALGSLAGLAIGVYEARALSRARAAEEHLQEFTRERNLREKIVETSPVGIAVADADRTLSFANDHLADILGWPADDLIGRNYDSRMFEATGPDGEPIEAGIFDRVLTTGDPVYDVERHVTRRDGQRIWLSVNGAPLHDATGDVTGVVFAVEDITERKEREEELALFRRLIDHSNDAVFVIDPDTAQLVDVNQTACHRLGYDRADLLKLTVLDIEANLSDREAWESHVDEVRSEKESGLTFEGEHRRADGTTFPAEVNVNYITLDQEYMCAIARDVTERKERKQELRERNERLEQFASMLAHELRNPVTIGQIYSEQLPENPETEAVEYVTEAFDRIEDMIDVMLVLTRGQEAVGECTPVNLAGVAREAWDEVDAPDATLEVAINRTIDADETYMRHLFRNLFENAVEHGGAGVTVTVGDLNDGFYVADNGPGIEPTDYEAVFEAGYTTAADGGGTGLGLAFVEALADVYDWTCTVSKSDAGGAQFEFRNIDQDSCLN